MSLADLLTALEQLCTRCARCCNGRIFAATLLEPAEAVRFGVLELPQPCPHLVGTRCGVYASRPSSCSRYLCPTAAELVAGTLTLEQARAQLER